MTQFRFERLLAANQQVKPLSAPVAEQVAGSPDQAKIAIFSSRGLDEKVAQALIDQLEDRDRDRDDRRACPECRRFKNGRCVLGMGPIGGGGLMVLFRCREFRE